MYAPNLSSKENLSITTITDRLRSRRTVSLRKKISYVRPFQVNLKVGDSKYF
jgi:hypothetical protein